MLLHTTRQLNYTFFVIDEPCFTGRDGSGALMENKTTWPHGLKAFGAEVRPPLLLLVLLVLLALVLLLLPVLLLVVLLLLLLTTVHCRSCCCADDTPCPLQLRSHSMALGIYTCVGPKTCAGCVASQGHEEQDVKTFADWGGAPPSCAAPVPSPPPPLLLPSPLSPPLLC